MAIRSSDQAVGYGLAVGTPNIRSAGPIAFGPESILLLADSVGATIFAIAVEALPATRATSLDVERLDERLAAWLGCPVEDVDIRDMAVDPGTQGVYLSVTRGRGDGAIPLVVRVDSDELTEVPLRDVPFAQAPIEDAPADGDERKDIRVLRDDEPGGQPYDARGTLLQLVREPLRSITVTDIGYLDGTVIVAGASNEEFTSTLRQIPFPFRGDARSSTLEIFHVSHGKWETHSPIRNFVAYGDDMSVLASYTCTPIVRFSLDDLRGTRQARGHTVAELGAMNTPLGMVAYRRDGEEYLLVSNSRHELYRLSRRDLDGQEALTTPHEPVGAPRQALPHEGVGRMAVLNDEHVLMLQRIDGHVDLHSYSTASL
ncbi:MAG TPA: hypothetical protein VN193_06800 [Candidatus Angelobacter sp.]|jgi:hypothetical protein|nr:hypothetical protein [Candidatus Angelobacter sp.]